MVQNFLLIDGSYFVFFRYYALLNWFKLAKKDQIIDKEHPPYENEEFVRIYHRKSNNKWYFDKDNKSFEWDFPTPG